jgi:transcription elongation GreA/GreB family factor
LGTEVEIDPLQQAYKEWLKKEIKKLKQYRRTFYKLWVNTGNELYKKQVNRIQAKIRELEAQL